MSVEVKLSNPEIFVAALCGVMRRLKSIQLDRKPAYGAPAEEDGWRMHIEGCLGELALARHLNVYWNEKGLSKEADVGENHEVRVGSRENYRLILHPTDHDDRRYWLLTGANGHYLIRGWILGKEGKQQRYWTDPGSGRPAFFVPQDALIPT